MYMYDCKYLKELMNKNLSTNIKLKKCIDLTFFKKTTYDIIKFLVGLNV